MLDESDESNEFVFSSDGLDEHSEHDRLDESDETDKF